MDWYSEIFILFDSIQFLQFVELLPTWINFSSEAKANTYTLTDHGPTHLNFLVFINNSFQLAPLHFREGTLANCVHEICIYYQQRVFITWSFSYSKQLSVSPFRWWIEITNTSIHENEKSSISWPMVSKHI